jgi:hypothetical protein
MALIARSGEPQQLHGDLVHVGPGRKHRPRHLQQQAAALLEIVQVGHAESVQPVAPVAANW